MFRKIKGQDRSISILRQSIENHKIAQSYLFYGPDGVGKFTTALYYGMALNCHAYHENKPCGTCVSCKKFLSFTHPDMLYIFPTPNMEISPEGEIKQNKYLEEYQNFKKNKIEKPWNPFFFSSNTAIRIDMIRMLQNRIRLSLSEGEYKVYIIENADKMNNEAANAFLKTLEEPPPNTVIIMTTSKPDSLLPTILSRCQKIQFVPISGKIIEKELLERNLADDYDAKMFARISNGNMEKSIQIAEKGKLETREETRIFINLCLEKNDLIFLEFSENYKSSKTQNQLLDILSYLIIWLSDISFFANCSDEIINIDQIEVLEIIYHNNPRIDRLIPELINFIEIMKYRLQGHINPKLILIEVYNKLSKAFN